jgi:hypothetical protein
VDTPASDAASSGIFGLPRDLVRAVLETACGEPVIDYTARLRQRTGLEGIFGEYLVASFTARTRSGLRTELPMFVRRQLRPSDRKRQAHHYEYLSAAGVPLPRLYGSHVDAEGREILFLELLDEIGASDEALLARPDYLEELLPVVAGLAAVPLTDDYVGRLGYDMAGRDFVLNWGGWLPWSVHILGRIEARAPAGDLGDGLRDYCAANPQAIRGLKRLCLPLMGAVRSLPVGLVHGDMRPGNTGRRAADGALVLYDLEDLSIDARFYDAGLILGGPRTLVAGTHSNDELAGLFLESYVARSGRAVSLETFLREARIVWAARRINLWEMLPPSAGGPPYDSRAFATDREEREARFLATLTDLVESLASLWEAVGG